MMRLPPGLHTGIPAEVYHGDPAEEPSLSASAAWTLLKRSPAHARVDHPRLNPDFKPEEKAIYDIGSAAHNMVLRQDFWREEIEVIDADAWRTKAAKEARDEARAAGRYPILRDQYEALNAMVSALEQHPQASRAFRAGQPEVSMIWKDPETGIHLRCRPDWMPDNPEAPKPDYKTTEDAGPDWDRIALRQHGLRIRAALYEEGWRQVCGIARPVLYYVVQEKSPPYVVSCPVIDPDGANLRYGRAMLRRACRVWADCLSSGKWPDNGGVRQVAEPGEWEERDLHSRYFEYLPQKESSNG